MTFSVFVGVFIFAVCASVAFLQATIRSHSYRKQELFLQQKNRELQQSLHQLEFLLEVENQILLIWNSITSPPSMRASPKILSEVCPSKMNPLSWKDWLPAETVGPLEREIETLLRQGKSFTRECITLEGKSVEIAGKLILGKALLTIKVMSGLREQLILLQEKLSELYQRTQNVRDLINAAPLLIWFQDEKGEILWTNEAFKKVFPDPKPVDSTQKVEFPLETARLSVLKKREKSNPKEHTFPYSVPILLQEKEHVFEIWDVAFDSHGLGSMALDVTERNQIQSAYEHRLAIRNLLLEQIEIAAVAFHVRQGLTFFNQAYQNLWKLPENFLQQKPSHDEVLEHLRERNVLPVEMDFRSWKKKLQTFSPEEDSVVSRDMWHLPDGRTLHVTQVSHGSEEILFLFEDITQRLALESNFERKTRIQAVTLNNLEEAFVVFGSDGRLSLYNNAFANLWGIPEAFLEEKPHVEQIFGTCEKQASNPAVWSSLLEAIVSLHELRKSFRTRLEKEEGKVLDIAVVPLPGGDVLITFRDITDAFLIQKALAEKNEALEAMTRIKNDFVGNLSYQLRTPLTSVIGFAQVLGDPSIGTLNERQQLYLEYINASATTLLSLINDILDLATIDTGAMSLNFSSLQASPLMIAAKESIQSRLQEKGIQLDLQIPENLPAFEADPQRMRQIFFNLLAQAVEDAPKAAKIQFSVQLKNKEIIFSILSTYQPKRVELSALEDLKPERTGSAISQADHFCKTGSELSLSIVQAFVKLHQGRLVVDQTDDQQSFSIFLPTTQAISPHTSHDKKRPSLPEV